MDLDKLEAEIRRDPLLVEREKTHGDFRITAQVAQQLKASFKTIHYQGLSAPHKEALDMIATKLARILSGNPNEKDHWLDLAGYAKLGMEYCDDRK